MTNTKLLREKIEASGLKQEYIAKCIGLTSYGFARKRDNIATFTAPEISKLCDVLKIDSSEEMMAIFFASNVD